jgi:hypothetical protein
LGHRHSAQRIGTVAADDSPRATQVHNAHRMEMRGESMRKKRDPPPDENKE